MSCHVNMHTWGVCFNMAILYKRLRGFSTAVPSPVLSYDSSLRYYPCIGTRIVFFGLTSQRTDGLRNTRTDSTTTERRTTDHRIKVHITTNPPHLVLSVPSFMYMDYKRQYLVHMSISCSVLASGLCHDEVLAGRLLRRCCRRSLFVVVVVCRSSLSLWAVVVVGSCRWRCRVERFKALSGCLCGNFVDGVVVSLLVLMAL